VRRETLPFGERAMLRVMDAYSRVFMGVSSLEFSTELVKSFGMKGFMAWGQMAQTVLKDLAAHFGDADAQMLIGAAAFWNGCTYCGTGHTYAANLLRFKQTGKLFPLDEGEVRLLQRHTDREILEFWDSEFGEWRRELTMLKRLWELKFTKPTDTRADDAYIQMAIAAWDWATECTVLMDVTPVPPPHRIGADKANTSAYEAARSTWRGDRKTRGLMPYT
jgi:hypothetical protein